MLEVKDLVYSLGMTFPNLGLVVIKSIAKLNVFSKAIKPVAIVECYLAFEDPSNYAW
jgi:hypothetical protein